MDRRRRSSVEPGFRPTLASSCRATRSSSRHRTRRPGRHPLRSLRQHPESRPASLEMLLRRRACHQTVGTDRPGPAPTRRERTARERRPSPGHGRHPARQSRPGDLSCAEKPRAQACPSPWKRRRETPRRRLQNDRNRTDLRPGTAVERRALNTEKKRLTSG